MNVRENAAKQFSRQRTVNSIVLLANGISFSIQAVIFVFLGSFAGTVPSLKPMGKPLFDDCRLRKLETLHPDCADLDRCRNRI